MALILATRHRARLVFVGAFAALAAVTLISLALGFGLREVLPAWLLPWLAALLFLGFGLKLFVDAQAMGADQADDEARDAEQTVAAAERQRPIVTARAVVLEAFVLVFLAELGDRTQITTVVLATAPALTLGGCSPVHCWAMAW